MFSLEERNGTPVVRVRGEVDMTSAGEFRNNLTAAVDRATGRVVVALDECTYFDSTAVGVLVGAQKKFGERLVVVMPELGVVRKILNISGVERYVVLAGSIDEALTA